jgi:Flp pilus assembly protein TadB
MNLAIALVAGLMLFEPFTRPPVSRFTTHRMRRCLAKRAYWQASAAFLAALLVVTYQPPPERISPLLVLGVALLLMTASIYWIVRGKRLMRQRRVFNDFC